MDFSNANFQVMPDGQVQCLPVHVQRLLVAPPGVQQPAEVLLQIEQVVRLLFYNCRKHRSRCVVACFRFFMPAHGGKDTNQIGVEACDTHAIADGGVD